MTSSDLMLPVFEQASRVAEVDTTVLIRGESGAGKELVAEAIHANSPRGRKPLVIINMAAVSKDLLESELFGHMAGAFTGSTATRKGRFEAAHEGTLFIDEIGDFALECQAKLLRVLETHCVTPVGSNQDRHIDVRVIAATNRNLEKMVREGEFREELYYRLNVVSITLPPLTMNDLPTMVRNDRRHDSIRIDIPEGLTLKQIESAVVHQTLDRCRGNRTHAAKLLGVSVRTLQRQLKRRECVPA